MSINMKRKHVILFALFLLLSAGKLWAQEQKPYKPAAMFKADTLQYLEYNYDVVRSVDYYKDKTVGEVLRELEYPVLYIVSWSFCDDKLLSLSLGIRQVGKEPSPLEDYYIIVAFANPPQISDFRALFDRDVRNPVFTSQIYDFIKDLKVSHVASNPYIIMKRRNLEAKRIQEEIEREKQADENEQSK